MTSDTISDDCPLPTTHCPLPTAHSPLVARAVELFKAAWPAKQRQTKQCQQITDMLAAAVSRALAESELVQAAGEMVNALQFRDDQARVELVLMHIGPRLLAAFKPFQKVPHGTPRRAKMTTTEGTEGTEEGE